MQNFIHGNDFGPARTRSPHRWRVCEHALFAKLPVAAPNTNRSNSSTLIQPVHAPKLPTGKNAGNINSQIDGYLKTAKHQIRKNAVRKKGDKGCCNATTAPRIAAKNANAACSQIITDHPATRRSIARKTCDAQKATGSRCGADLKFEKYVARSWIKTTKDDDNDNAVLAANS